VRALVLGGVALGLAIPASAAVAEPSLQDIQQQIKTSSTQLEKVVEDYNKINAQLTASRAQAAQITAQLAPLQAQYDAALSAVQEMAASAYKTGQAASAGALLGSGSAGGLLDRLTALEQVARTQSAETAGLASARVAVEEQKRKLDELVAAQTAAQADLAARKAKIEKDLSRLYELRKQAYGAAQESPSAAGSGSAPYVAGKAGIAVKYAYGALGKPYVWAADGPDGYDCSGLTMAAWRAAGVQLSHQASMQWREVAHISRSQLRPGDLVFYEGLGHVAIYVGSSKVIHAPTFGEVVKIVSVDIMTPYGYGRPG
jgi:cell wall-associated NlpC family hydrolase